MNKIFGTTDPDKTEEPQEEPTCSLCRSPLIQEAIDAGKCQCCGNPIKQKTQEFQEE